MAPKIVSFTGRTGLLRSRFADYEAMRDAPDPTRPCYSWGDWILARPVPKGCGPGPGGAGVSIIPGAPGGARFLGGPLPPLEPLIDAFPAATFAAPVGSTASAVRFFTVPFDLMLVTVRILIYWVDADVTTGAIAAGLSVGGMDLHRTRFDTIALQDSRSDPHQDIATFLPSYIPLPSGETLRFAVDAFAEVGANNVNHSAQLLYFLP